MFTTAHLTSGLLVAAALGLEGRPFAALVLASVLTDWDYAFQLLTGRPRRVQGRGWPRFALTREPRNHRTFLTHCPPLVAAALALVALREPLAWWLLAGAMLHFALDVWEYGVRLHPFSREVVGFRLMPGVERLPFGAYLRAYFADRRFLAAEAALALLALVTLAARWATGWRP